MNVGGFGYTPDQVYLGLYSKENAELLADYMMVIAGESRLINGDEYMDLSVSRMELINYIRQTEIDIAEELKIIDFNINLLVTLNEIVRINERIKLEAGKENEAIDELFLGTFSSEIAAQIYFGHLQNIYEGNYAGIMVCNNLEVPLGNPTERPVYCYFVKWADFAEYINSIGSTIRKMSKENVERKMLYEDLKKVEADSAVNGRKLSIK